MKPLLLIGGAPKAGTSYLFDLLAQHPQLCPSQPKETFYFVDEDYPLADPKKHYCQGGVSGFQTFFKPDQNTAYLLEGSTHLLYQKAVIPTIRDLNAEVIFVLREPARRLLSAFEYTKNRGAILQKEVSFGEYVKALLDANEKQIHEWVRPKTAYHFLHRELDFSTYAPHLQHWYDALGKERVHVLQFEQFVQEPVQNIQTLFGQLGISPYDINPQVSKHNTYQIQHKKLHFYIRYFNKFIPKNHLRNFLRNWYFYFQKRPLQQDTSTDVSLIRLRQYFHTHNQELAKLSEINLEYWS